MCYASISRCSQTGGEDYARIEIKIPADKKETELVLRVDMSLEALGAAITGTFVEGIARVVDRASVRIRARRP